jgi:YD repeat-containing protein
VKLNLQGRVVERRLTAGALTFNHWYEYTGRGLLGRAYASTSSGTPATPDAAYSYRPSGAVATSSVTDAVAATLGWDAQSGSFSYDANGNMTSSPAPYSVTGATYDHRNLPTALVTVGADTTWYRYDHAGQRTAKRVGGGHTQVYLLDGTVTLGVVTLDGAGAVVEAQFNVIADGQAVGRQEVGGARLHYRRDLLGSTRAVTEGALVVESYDYDPWGVLMPGRTVAGTTREGFTTKERDLETGLAAAAFQLTVDRASILDVGGGEGRRRCRCPRPDQAGTPCRRRRV